MIQWRHCFDGSTTYLKRGGGLTGAADSKSITVSCWLKVEPNAGCFIYEATTALNGTAQRTGFGVSSSVFFVQGFNAAGSVILDQRSINITPEGRWVHVLASFDLSTVGRRHLYVDDVSDNNSLTFTNDTIDFTMADWGIGATPGGTGKFPGAMGDLWVAPGVYIDLSVEANRRKFITADRRPVNLGATGNVPTGAAPLIFMSGDIASWHTNKGTGGGFTKSGDLAEADFATGEIKCFNSNATCQDPTAFDPADVTWRFAKPVDYLPRAIDIEAPSIDSVAYTPATVSLGKNLGTRATLQVTFKDHPHSDTGEGYDKYLAERDYDPFLQGTFWGKFRARQPFMRGQSARFITGLVGQDIGQMETHHLIVNSIEGPTPDGKFSILAKDALKLADGDRAQCPALSTGFLQADITAVQTSAVLLPAGVGNAEYAASGFLNIGGNEVVSFTRAADTLTITRGQLGSTASTHKAQDRVQVVKRYAAADPADVLNDLLTNFAGMPAAYITVADWQAETAAFLGTLYTANICEPTSVAALISELIEQAGLVLWWDDIGEKIRLQVLRGITTDAATFTPENFIAGTLGIKEQPETRLSQVQTYFGQKDPTKPLSNLDNYRSTSLVIDEEAEADYGSAAIKTIVSRWIPEAGRTVADRLGAVILGRFRDGVRRLTFSTARYAGTDVELGRGYRLEAYCIQDPTGAQADMPLQVTRVNPTADRFVVEAEEMRFTASAVDLTDRQIVYDANNANINLRSSHDSIYPPPVAGDTVTFTINSGVMISSSGAASIAVNAGSWPAGVTINLMFNGDIRGAGGAAGVGGNYFSGSGAAGQAGGIAFYTRVPVNLSYPPGSKIWAGGGGGGGGGGGETSNGGGGGGGGGGAGTVAGGGAAGGFGANSGVTGSAGSSTGGGAAGSGGGLGDKAAGGAGGVGGAPGVAGSSGSFGITAGGAAAAGAPGAGGAAGVAIDGISFVTIILSGGSIAGTTIN